MVITFVWEPNHWPIPMRVNVLTRPGAGDIKIINMRVQSPLKLSLLKIPILLNKLGIKTSFLKILIELEPLYPKNRTAQVKNSILSVSSVSYMLPILLAILQNRKKIPNERLITIGDIDLQKQQIKPIHHNSRKLIHLLSQFYLENTDSVSKRYKIITNGSIPDLIESLNSKMVTTQYSFRLVKENNSVKGSKKLYINIGLINNDYFLKLNNTPVNQTRALLNFVLEELFPYTIINNDKYVILTDQNIKAFASEIQNLPLGHLNFYVKNFALLSKANQSLIIELLDYVRNIRILTWPCLCGFHLSDKYICSCSKNQRYKLQQSLTLLSRKIDSIYLIKADSILKNDRVISNSEISAVELYNILSF